jgi:hypothetical protein
MSGRVSRCPRHGLPLSFRCIRRRVVGGRFAPGCRALRLVEPRPPAALRSARLDSRTSPRATRWAVARRPAGPGRGGGSVRSRWARPREGCARDSGRSVSGSEDERGADRCVAGTGGGSRRDDGRTRSPGWRGERSQCDRSRSRRRAGFGVACADPDSDPSGVPPRPWRRGPTEAGLPPRGGCRPLAWSAFFDHASPDARPAVIAWVESGAVVRRKPAHPNAAAGIAARSARFVRNGLDRRVGHGSGSVVGTRCVDRSSFGLAVRLSACKRVHHASRSDASTTGSPWLGDDRAIRP